MRLLLALIALLVLAPAASAAKLERSGGTMTFTAGAGETNYVNGGRSFAPEGWTVESRAGLFGAAIAPSPLPTGCTTNGTTTTCTPLDPLVTQWVLIGLDGNDILNSFWAAARVEGGEGNDQMESGDQGDVLLGGPGDEIWLKGNDGADQLDGGPGSDRLFPGDGTDADDVRGGTGTDEVTYQDNNDAEPVSVTLDDVANDGRPGALGNVHSDVEDLLGGDGDDFLKGDADNNRIRGDLDSFGQDGDDILDGGLGRDVLEGGAGNDEIRARDGVADDVLCGPGTDTAIVDTIDLVTDCETVDASAELEPDRDGDGFATPADCDDHDAAIHPGVTDVPENGVDEDCTGGDLVILDRDGDGVSRPADCDDGNPLVRPGLAEIPGNAVDEDCKGGPAAFRPIGAEITSRWSTKGRRTKVARLVARNVPAGATVVLKCKGGGCPKPRTVRKEIGKRKDVKLHPLLAGRRLKAGAVVQVRVVSDSAIGAVAKFRMRKGKLPVRRTLCMPPGTSKPKRCA
jgi:Ca2+-binding RTX toxin-like protein